MAIAVANYCFSALTSTVKFPCSISSQRRLATSHSSSLASANHKNQNFKNSPSTSKSSTNTTDRKFPGRSKDGSGETERSQSTAFKSFGAQRKDKKEFQFDSKDQMVESGNLQDAAFLNAVVKVYCTHTAPDYSLPWQKQRQYTSTGSAFMIGDGRLLTNAHCVEHYTQVKVKRRGDDTKYVAKDLGYTLRQLIRTYYENKAACDIAHNPVQHERTKHVEIDKSFVKEKLDENIAELPKIQYEDQLADILTKVLARGVDCDIALLSVESEEFWKGAEPLHFGHLPRLQDAVTVVGYPLGGDTISVTKGVVSRIEVTSYAHGSSELLGIQIDAAINPGNSGGPAFNDKGDCIGVAFQVYRSEEVENIGYVIPTTVVSHFLSDYERNGKYTGFPCLGVLLQKLENPALRACLKVPSNEGVLVRRVEPTADANNVLKEGDVIVSFDDVHVGSEGTVPFRSNERIAFRYLISLKFAGDVAELGIIRAGTYIKVKVILNPRVHLVPYNIDGGQPSYLIIAGLVFTPLSEPLIEEECDDSIGLKLLAKARYSLARFKGEQIVILSQVLANEVSIGYEDMSNQQVLKFNGTRVKNIHHLAHLVDSCEDRFLVFEFEDNYLAVLEREAATASSLCILKDYGIPAERSSDLLEPYVDPSGDNQAIKQDSDDSPVSNLEIGFDGLLWA